MKNYYKVKPTSFYGVYIVMVTTITPGERTSALFVGEDKIDTFEGYRGSLSDCNAFIQLKCGGYLS